MYSKNDSVPKAALKAGMDAKTARKWLAAGGLPSEKPKQARTWRTRQNPFSEVWQEVVEKLDHGNELQIKDLFQHLCKKHPEKWEPNQLRTLQRLVKKWRALNGPPKLAFLEQNHTPGDALQADFSELKSLNITICSEHFTFMIFHSTLPYSNWEWITVSRSESILALKRGLQESLKELGVKPKYFQTDNSTSATHRVGNKRQIGGNARAFNDEYVRFCESYSVTPRTTEVGEKEQNGDIESSHNHFKKAVASALVLRGSSDFQSVLELEKWLQDLARERNSTEKRKSLFLEEQKAMRSCKIFSLKDYKESTAMVSKFSNITIGRNVYSVPSRLIKQMVNVRQHEWHIEIYHQNILQLETKRIHGTRQHSIDYRHVIWSLVKKPGAFACYRYRDEMFPSLVFRRAYDAITGGEASTKKDLEYLRILHLAASISEDEVKVALELLITHKIHISYDNVKNLVACEKSASTYHPQPCVPDLKNYDRLIGGAI
jgi:hypothetical protein